MDSNTEKKSSSPAAAGFFLITHTNQGRAAGRACSICSQIIEAGPALIRATPLPGQPQYSNYEYAHVDCYKDGAESPLERIQRISRSEAIPQMSLPDEITMDQLAMEMDGALAEIIEAAESAEQYLSESHPGSDPQQRGLRLKRALDNWRGLLG